MIGNLDNDYQMISTSPTRKRKNKETVNMMKILQSIVKQKSNENGVPNGKTTAVFNDCSGIKIIVLSTQFNYVVQKCFSI